MYASLFHSTFSIARTLRGIFFFWFFHSIASGILLSPVLKHRLHDKHRLSDATLQPTRKEELKSKSFKSKECQLTKKLQDRFLR